MAGLVPAINVLSAGFEEGVDPYKKVAAGYACSPVSFSSSRSARVA